MAFFLEATFIGLMTFGWQRLSRGTHLLVTFLVGLGSNLSALWILVANGFMQDPQGAAFNPVTMRMELTSFGALIFSPDAQTKFVHTSIAGYVTAAIFVSGISAFYMLRGRHMELARRSFRMAALFGVLATAGVITLGDALGFVGGHAQPSKLAAMEGDVDDGACARAVQRCRMAGTKRTAQCLEMADPLCAHAAVDAQSRHGYCPVSTRSKPMPPSAYVRAFRQFKRSGCLARIRTMLPHSLSSSSTRTISALASWCSAMRRNRTSRTRPRPTSSARRRTPSPTYSRCSGASA